MRHLLVMGTLILIGAVITFGTASILQSAAIARAPSSQPFVLETAGAPGKPATKQSASSTRSRDAFVRTASVSGS